MAHNLRRVRIATGAERSSSRKFSK